MKLPPFAYERPSTIGEAVVILGREGDGAHPLTGGQCLMPLMPFRPADQLIGRRLVTAASVQSGNEAA
jgi:CO/xanthine dehydrogenase FAD-binding subunit